MQIPGPTAPAGPTTPASVQVTTAPDIGKAPAAMPPVVEKGNNDDDPFNAENVSRLQNENPDRSKTKTELSQEKAKSDRERDENGKFAKDKPPEKAPEAKVDKPADKPATPADAKVDETTKGGRITGWQMARKHEATIKELNAKLETLGKAAPAPAKATELKIDEHPAYKEVSEKFTKAETRRTELEDEIRWHNYEKSEEYQTKYMAPYQDAYKQAVGDVSSFRINQEDGNTRAATREDFDRVLFASNPAAALDDAEKLFGPTAANYIVGLRNQVIRASSAAHQAREEFRTKGAAELKSRADARERESAGRAESFHRHVNEAAEKNPQWFKETEGDDEGNTLLKQGYMLADASFGGHVYDEQTKQMREPTNEEVVALNAMLRSKAGAFDRVVHRHKIESKAREERIAELEAELADYRDSEPGAGEGAQKKGKDGDEDDPFKRFDR